MKRASYTIPNIAIFVALVAVGMAWLADHRRLQNENQALQLQLTRHQLQSLLAHRDVETRRRALAELRDLAAPESIPALLYAMTDPMIDISIDARSTLEKITGQSFRENNQDPTYKTLEAELERWQDWYRNQPEGRAFIPFRRESTETELLNGTQN